jgi:hypothetical protein
MERQFYTIEAEGVGETVYFYLDDELSAPAIGDDYNEDVEKIERVIRESSKTF